MAVHNPGNRALERLALETKVNVFQRYNRLLQAPPTHVDHRPDVMICSSMLIFAMDVSCSEIRLCTVLTCCSYLNMG